MTKDEFQIAIYNRLTEKGYKAVKTFNGEPYNAKDIYFCPQATNLFLLTILPGRTEIRKVGKNGYTASLSTEVKGPADIDRLHEEINNIIFKSDESSLKNKHSGCMLTILILLIPIVDFFIHF